MNACIEMGGIDLDGRFWMWAQDTLVSPIGLQIGCMMNRPLLAISATHH